MEKSEAARRYWIEPAKLSHVGELARSLRPGDRREIEIAGLAPRHAIRSCIRQSTFARTAFIDGQIAGMIGLAGVLLSDVGEPWMLTTPVVERLPTFFLREARKGVQDMLALKPKLEGYVDADYEAACDFLTALDFRLDDPIPYRGARMRRFHMERA